MNQTLKKGTDRVEGREMRRGRGQGFFQCSGIGPYWTGSLGIWENSTSLAQFGKVKLT